MIEQHDSDIATIVRLFIQKKKTTQKQKQKQNDNKLLLLYYYYFFFFETGQANWDFHQIEFLENFYRLVLRMKFIFSTKK